jgi:ribulose kinase
MKKKCKKIDLTDYVKVKAKELWEKSGCRQGRDLEHWLQAEEKMKDLLAIIKRNVSFYPGYILERNRAKKRNG